MSHKLTKRHVRSIKKMMEHKGQHELRKEEKAQRRLARAQQQERAPRRRDWVDDEDAASFEKIRRVKAEAVVPLPATPRPEAAVGATGTVIEVRSGDSLVAFGGAVVRGILPPGARLVDPQMRSPIAVGDRVQIEPISSTEVRIVGVLPRRSALVRAVFDPSRWAPPQVKQVVAANIDQVVIVCTPAEPPFRPRLIDRYLVAASRDGLTPAICLNKTDLGVPRDVERYLEGYARLGARIVRTSATTGAGVDVLRDVLATTVSLLAGHSGVGKSSLLNALEPGLGLRVREVTQAAAGQGKGRHTTASARLVPLSLPDTFVVDSPGIRAFSVRGLPARELAEHFPEIAARASGCAYRDCLHCGETGCAVERAARDDGFLRARLESYRGILGDLT